MRRIIGILNSFTVVRGMAVSGFMFLFPLFLLSKGYNVAELGSIVTYASVLSILFLPVVGYLVDHGWEKEVMIASGLLLLLSLILPPVLPTMSIFVLSYMFLSLSLFLLMPARNRIIAKIVSQTHLGRTNSTFIVSFNNISRTIYYTIYYWKTHILGLR